MLLACLPAQRRAAHRRKEKREAGTLMNLLPVCTHDTYEREPLGALRAIRESV